jgi:hypothetical protein
LIPREASPTEGREVLISTKGGSVIIEDWDGLREAGEFDPTYLHQKKAAA